MAASSTTDSLRDMVTVSSGWLPPKLRVLLWRVQELEGQVEPVGEDILQRLCRTRPVSYHQSSLWSKETGHAAVFGGLSPQAGYSEMFPRPLLSSEWNESASRASRIG